MPRPLYTWTFLIFTGAWLIAAAIGGQWFPPRTFSPVAIVHKEKPLIHLDVGVPLSLEFDAPAASLFRMEAQFVQTDAKGNLRITLENLTRDKTLLEADLGQGLRKTLSWTPANRAGDRIRLTYLVTESQKARFPGIRHGIRRCAAPPALPLDVSLGGQLLTSEEVETEELWPMFSFRYRSAWIWLQYLWPLPLVLLLIRAGRTRSPPAEAAFLLLIGVAATGLSLNLWFDRFGMEWPYADPDRYAQYGVTAADWILHGEAQVDAGEQRWLDKFPHAHAPLTPAVIGVGRLTGLDTLPVYAWWVVSCSFATLLMFHWFFRHRLGLSNGTALVAVTAVAFHLIFLRACGKASTDPSGLALMTAGLLTVLERIRRPFRWREHILAALLLILLTISRPPGFAVAMMLVIFLWLAAHVHHAGPEGGSRLLKSSLLAGLPLIPFAYFGILPLSAAAVVSGAIWLFLQRQDLLLRQPQTHVRAALHALPSLAVFTLGYFALDWGDNLEAAFAKADNYAVHRDAYHFVSAFFSNAYPLLLAAPFLLRRPFLREPVVQVAALWILGFLLVLLALKAPFYNRLLMPVLTGVVLIAAQALARVESRRRRWMPLLAVGVTGLSAGIAWLHLWIAYLPGHPPLWLVRWTFF